MDRIGLDWGGSDLDWIWMGVEFDRIGFGLDWIGLDLDWTWIGLDWIGVDRSGLNWI